MFKIKRRRKSPYVSALYLQRRIRYGKLNIFQGTNIVRHRLRQQLLQLQQLSQATNTFDRIVTSSNCVYDWKTVITVENYHSIQIYYCSRIKLFLYTLWFLIINLNWPCNCPSHVVNTTCDVLFIPMKD